MDTNSRTAQPASFLVLPPNESGRQLPVSIYFCWQWWEEHYQHEHGRPDHIDMDWLDATCLGRQRFLNEAFGRFGVGEADPVLDRGFVSRVIPYNGLLVPLLLGVQVEAKEVGGYHWQSLEEDELADLRPLDIADTPLGDWIVRLRDERLARYGTVAHMIDLGSTTNNAFLLRGQEFYVDLIADKSFARHYMNVVTETMCLAYRFVSDAFAPIQGFPIGNCNVPLMSPDLYVEMVREYDIRCVLYASELTGQPPCCDLHHCDVRTEPFAEAYSAIPGLRSLQGSHLSDIAAIRQALPRVSFSAMVNPLDLLQKPAAQVDGDLDRCIAAGAHDLALWNIDPAYGPRETGELFRRIRDVAARHGREAIFSVIPITWEELGWEFPCYQ